MFFKVWSGDHLHQGYLEGFQKYSFLGLGITGLERDGAQDSIRMLKFENYCTGVYLETTRANFTEFL